MRAMRGFLAQKLKSRWPIEMSTAMQADLARLTRSIVEAFHPQKIILFGSRANGRVRPDSDVDILVIMESEKPAGRRAADIYRRLGWRKFPLDVIVFTPVEIARKMRGFDPFLEDVMKNGRVLYEAG
jgi:predicted nucleotidyltransferase